VRRKDQLFLSDEYVRREGTLVPVWWICEKRGYTCSCLMNMWEEMVQLFLPDKYAKERVQLFLSDKDVRRKGTVVPVWRM
jgi:hypothetical protein